MGKSAKKWIPCPHCGGEKICECEGCRSESPKGFLPGLCRGCSGSGGHWAIVSGEGVRSFSRVAEVDDDGGKAS